MSGYKHKSHRGRAGASAAKIVNRRYPLRKVVSQDESGREILECGHTQSPVWDMIGQTYAARRRCKSCPPRDLCTCGHFFDDHAESYAQPVTVYPNANEIRIISEGCLKGIWEESCSCEKYENVPPEARAS